MTVSTGKKRVAVLVSGGGTNLQALIDYTSENSSAPYAICLVISSTKKALAIERAAKAGIECLVLSPMRVMGDAARDATREQKMMATSNAVLHECIKRNVDIIVLAGYLSVLSGEILAHYEGRIINLHPSLLPAHGGVGMWGERVHQAVIDAGEQVSGCTVHLVDSGCDTGRIIVQKRVSVQKGDDAHTLAARIAPYEHEAIVEGLLMLCNDLKTISTTP